MRVLVACEYSGLVRDAFLVRGHDALSCDLEPTERPGPHYQGDVRDILDQGWDMMIAFPPCTYLSYAANHVWNIPGREEKREEALQFVKFLMDAPIKRIALENPLGYIGKAIRKPDQIIHPYFFGHGYTKRTCLWLKNLPPLMATCIEINHCDFVGTMKHTKGRPKNRSRTFENVAFEMARQWGTL